MMLDITSAPTTSACSTRPGATIAAVVSEYRKPEQAAPRSNPRRAIAPSLGCTRHAVLGNIVSGVVVQTTMKPMFRARSRVLDGARGPAPPDPT